MVIPSRLRGVSVASVVTTRRERQVTAMPVAGPSLLGVEIDRLLAYYAPTLGAPTLHTVCFVRDTVYSL